MFENFRSLEDKNLKEKYKKLILKSKKRKHFSIKDNNDTIDIFFSFISYIEHLISSFYNSFKYYIHLLNLFSFRYHFLLLLIFMLFTFAFTLDNNSEISTNLIISAYFPKKHITRITYDMLLQKEKNGLNINNVEYDDLTKSNNDNKKGISDDYITCDRCNNNVKDNKIKQKNINKNIKKEDSSLKNMLSKVKKQKYNLPNWSAIISHNNLNNFLFYNQTFKSTIMIIFSFFYFYFYIKYTIYSSIKDSFIFNIFFIVITFNILYYSYQSGFYFSSNFFFAILIYNNKCLIESVYIMLSYKRKDFEIFSTSLIAFNLFQFTLKFIVLLNLTAFSGILSIFFFRTWFNFVLFYICFFTLFVFISNCFEPETSLSAFKPIKNLIIFFLGLFNLIFSKLFSHFIFKKICLILNLNSEMFYKDDQIDSLYFISDLFSLFCLGYIRGYIEFQIETILLIDQFFKDTDEKRLIKDLDNSEKFKMFPLLFLVCLLLWYLEFYKKEKIILFMSIYLNKILISYYSNLYDIQYHKLLYYSFCFLFIFNNIEFSYCEENIYLNNLLISVTGLDKDIIKNVIKIFISIIVYYYIITVNFNIIVVSSEKFRDDMEIRRLPNCFDNNLKIHSNNEKDDSEISYVLYDSFCIFMDIITNYFFICLLIAIYQYYEESIIIKIIILYSILQLCITRTLYLRDQTKVFDYYFSNYLWVWLSLRLISLCINEFSFILAIAHLNLIIFLYFFKVGKKNNFGLNIVLMIFVLILCWQIYSIFLFSYIFLILLLIFVPYTFNNLRYLNEDENKNDKEKKEENENVGIMNIYNSLSLLLLLPIICFFIIYLKYNEIYAIIKQLDTIIKELILTLNEQYENTLAKENFDWIDSVEFNFIDCLINFIERVRIEINGYN